MQGKGSGIAKAIIVFAVGMLVGFGTCASALIAQGKTQGWLFGLGSLIFFGSLFGMIVIAIIAIVRAVTGGPRRP